MAMSNDDRDFIERRMNDMDRRRDTNLAYKLEAVERLFNLAVQTKSEALRIAVDRLQNDNQGCLVRCSTQVRAFSEAIEAINRKLEIEQKAVSSLSHSLELLRSFVDTDHVTLGQEKVDMKGVIERLDTIEKWKDSYFTKNFVIGVSASFAVLQAILWAATWLLSNFGKYFLMGINQGP